MSDLNGFVSPLEQKQHNIQKGKLDETIRKLRNKLGKKRRFVFNILSRNYKNILSKNSNTDNILKQTNEKATSPNNVERVNDSEEIVDTVKNPIDKLKIQLKPSKEMKGHGNKVYAIAWNQVKQNEIVSASRDARLIFWNVESGYKRLAYNLETEFVMTVTYSPDCKFVACGGLDDEVSIFKINPNAIGVADDVKPCQILRGHSGYISCVEYIDNNKILSSSGDQTIRLWDIEKQCEIEKYNIHNSDVMSINVNNKNNNLFVSGSTDSTCKVSDIRESKNIKTVNIFNMEKLTDVNCVKWFRDNESIAAGCDDGVVKFFDQRTNYCLQNYDIEQHYDKDKYSKNLQEYLNKYSSDDSKDNDDDDNDDSKIDNNDNDNIDNKNEPVNPSTSHNKNKHDDYNNAVSSTTASNDLDNKNCNNNNNNNDDNKNDNSENSETNYDAYADEYEEDQFFASYQTNNRGNDGVAKLDFSLSGAFMFVSYNNGKKNDVLVWNTITGEIATELPHEHHVPCLAVSYEGNKLVTGCWDHKIRLWTP